MTEREKYTHTDLACERMRADTELAGVEYREEEREGCRISRLRITSREGAESIGKPEGYYVTMSFPPLFAIDEGALPALSEVLAELILEVCARLPTPPRTVLAVGLGNRALTADAVGPESIHRMIATRHLMLEEPALFKELSEVGLALLAPGVMGETGMEVLDLVAGVEARIRPDLILAIDALAARSTERLAATIQLSDTGICPGSGIGNARRPLNRETLGVPVIAIGMPTVVNSATLVLEAVHRAGLAEGELPPELERVLSEGRSFYVSPRDADVVTERGARLVADAVNRAFSHGFFGEG